MNYFYIFLSNWLKILLNNLLSLGEAIMKAKWLLDARKIPDEVMNYLRRIAVRAVVEKRQSPESI